MRFFIFHILFFLCLCGLAFNVVVSAETKFPNSGTKNSPSVGSGGTQYTMPTMKTIPTMTTATLPNTKGYDPAQLDPSCNVYKRKTQGGKSERVLGKVCPTKSPSYCTVCGTELARCKIVGQAPFYECGSYGPEVAQKVCKTFSKSDCNDMILSCCNN